MEELVHELKCRGNGQAVNKIVDLLGVPKIVTLCDLIIPAPSSKKRVYQPVDEIALELGRRVRIEVMIRGLEKARSKHRPTGRRARPDCPLGRPRPPQ